MSNRIVKHKINSPLVIRNRIQNYANRPEPTECGKGKYGAVIGQLSEAVRSCIFPIKEIPENGKKEKLTHEQVEKLENTTRMVLSWCFTPNDNQFIPISRGALTPQQINGLSRWMTELRDNDWVTRRMFRDELTWVLFWVGECLKWSCENTDLVMADLLKKYQDQSVLGSDHWNLVGFEQYVEMQYAEPEHEVIEPAENLPDIKDHTEDYKDFFAGL